MLPQDEDNDSIAAGDVVDMEDQPEFTTTDAMMVAALVDRHGADAVARMARHVETLHQQGLRLDVEAAAFVRKKARGRPRRAEHRLRIGWRVAVVSLMTTGTARISRRNVADCMMKGARAGDPVMRWALGLPAGRAVPLSLGTLENLTRRLPLPG